jgi:hypothetical protein
MTTENMPHFAEPTYRVWTGMSFTGPDGVACQVTGDAEVGVWWVRSVDGAVSKMAGKLIEGGRK